MRSFTVCPAQSAGIWSRLHGTFQTPSAANAYVTLFAKIVCLMGVLTEYVVLRARDYITLG